MFQLCLLVDMRLRRGIMSNQRSNNVNQRWNLQLQINVSYFRVDVNNFRQRQNNVVLFNFEFYNVGERGNNVLKMAISKKNEKKNHFKLVHCIQSFNCSFIILFTLLPILMGILEADLGLLQHPRWNRAVKF